MPPLISDNDTNRSGGEATRSARRTTLRVPTPAGRTFFVGRARGITLVALSGVLWSTVGLGVRMMESATPWQILFYRALAQTVVIVGWLLVRRDRGLMRSFANIGWGGVLAGVAISTASIAFVYALSITTVAEAVLVFSIAPVLAGLIGWPVLGEPIRKETWLAMVLVLVGVAIMNNTTGADATPLGTVLALLAALGFAVYTVLQKRRRHADVVPVIAVSGIVTAVVTVLPSLGTQPTAADLVVAFWLGGVLLAGGLALFTLGARHIRAAEAVVISMTEIVLAPIWVWWLLGETAAPSTLLGGGVLILGVVLQVWSGDRHSLLPRWARRAGSPNPGASRTTPGGRQPRPTRPDSPPSGRREG